MKGTAIIALATFAFWLAPGGVSWAGDHPKPKGNDTGCCFSFDNSPVNLVFCTTPGACTIGPQP